MGRISQAGPAGVLAVGAVIIDRTGRVLLVRRARAPGAGSWTLPGGRVEVGETLEAAIIREVREETALPARVVCPLDVVNIAREGFSYTIHEFLLTPLDSDTLPLAGDDAAEALWVQRESLSGLGVRLDVVEVIDRGVVEARARGLYGPSETAKI